MITRPNTKRKIVNARPKIDQPSRLANEDQPKTRSDTIPTRATIINTMAVVAI